MWRHLWLRLRQLSHEAAVPFLRCLAFQPCHLLARGPGLAKSSTRGSLDMLQTHFFHLPLSRTHFDGHIHSAFEPEPEPQPQPEPDPEQAPCLHPSILERRLCGVQLRQQQPLAGLGQPQLAGLPHGLTLQTPRGVPAAIQLLDIPIAVHSEG